MKNSIGIISVLIFLFVSFTCVNAQNHVLVKEDNSKGFLVWTVENKGVAISYADESCGHLSKNVLQNASDDAVAGEFDWTRMKDPNFREHVLIQECKRLRTEEKFRNKFANIKGEYSLTDKN